MFKLKKTEVESGPPLTGGDPGVSVRRKRRLWAFSAVLLTLLAAWLLTPLLLGAVGGLLVYESSDFAAVDAVVLLPGSVPDRALQAADLVSQSRAGKVLLVQDGRSKQSILLNKMGIEWPAHWQVNRRVLLARGIPEKQIDLIDGVSRATRDDARVVRDYLADHPLESLVVVTCPYHARRAYWNFRKELNGTGLKIYSVPSRYCDFDPRGWWKDRDQTLMVYLEWTKLLVFLAGKS